MEHRPLEEMLRRNQEIQTGRIRQSINAPPPIIPYKAEKNASMDDFIEMVDKMVSKTMRDMKVTFMPDDNNQLIKDQSEKIDHPYITHKVVSRTPDGELKHRVREQIMEDGHDKDDNRQGEVRGQRFICEVQFNIFASEYRMVQEVMKRFEENMVRYRHYFMKNGVHQLLFKRQFEDQNYQIFRENFSVRNLLYIVSIEHLIVGFNTEFEDISIQ